MAEFNTTVMSLEKLRLPQGHPSPTPHTDSQIYSRRPPEYTTPGFTILLTSELMVGAVAVLPPVTLVDGFRFSVNG